MAVGVPISTWLGSVLPWRIALGVIAAFGAIGFAGLLVGMKPAATTDEPAGASVHASLAAMFHPALLVAALVTVLGYSGSFTAFTYIAPLLTEITRLGAGTVSAFMLIFGVAAVIGNALGGRLTDRLGVDSASALIIGGITALALGIWAFAASPLAMGILVSLLGAFTFASVPALQARLLSVAEVHVPAARGVASGLNIAGFNAGIALGSFLGGAVLSTFGVRYTGLAGAAVSLLGLVLLMATHVRGNRHRRCATSTMACKSDATA